MPITKGLDLDVSDREDRYSDFGTTNNAKLSVRYQPIDFLTFRGTASTGFRAPTLFNLYSPPFLAASSSGTMGQGNPYCAPGHYTAEWTPATCNSQGLGLYGGNTNLTPETSQNFDFGVIVSPIQDMGITLDYYRILLKNTIGTIPASAIYGDPTAFANYIVPNDKWRTLDTPSDDRRGHEVQSLHGTDLWIHQADIQNTGRITTDGFDLSVQYLQHTPIGTFHEDLEGTAVTQFLEQQYNGGPNLNLVGNLQIHDTPRRSGGSITLRVDWTSPENMLGGGLGDRFYSSVHRRIPRWQRQSAERGQLFARRWLRERQADRKADRVVWNQESVQHESAVHQCIAKQLCVGVQRAHCGPVVAELLYQSEIHLLLNSSRIKLI